MLYLHIHTGDAEFKEEEHPRGEGGKWTSGGGGNAPKHPDLVGHKVSEPDPKSVVHFVGFKEGDQHYQNAVDVFGEPAFFHRVWDVRAQGDIVPGDTVVFAKGDSDQKPSAYVYDDSNQPDDPAAKERLEENSKPKGGREAELKKHYNLRKVPLSNINMIHSPDPDNAKVMQYRNDIRKGNYVDPIQVMKAKPGMWGKGDYTITDGHHRYVAHKAEGKTHIQVAFPK